MEKEIKAAVDKIGTIREAARISGISPSYLGDIINKNRKISWGAAMKLESGLGLDAYQIMKRQLDCEYEKKCKTR